MTRIHLKFLSSILFVTIFGHNHFACTHQFDGSLGKIAGKCKIMYSANKKQRSLWKKKIKTTILDKKGASKQIKIKQNGVCICTAAAAAIAAAIFFSDA